jgi:hypothetical protein
MVNMTPNAKLFFLERDLNELLEALRILDSFNLGVPKKLTTAIRHHRKSINTILYESTHP